MVGLFDFEVIGTSVGDVGEEVPFGVGGGGAVGGVDEGAIEDEGVEVGGAGFGEGGGAAVGVVQEGGSAGAVKVGGVVGGGVVDIASGTGDFGDGFAEAVGRRRSRFEWRDRWCRSYRRRRSW